MLFETERLYLREFTLSDAEPIYKLNLDPEVIKFTHDEPFVNADAARLFLQNYDHYKKYGYGRWGVIRKVNDQFIGWCGLKFNEDIDETDLGFRFYRSEWGKGYATEAALASLHYGFNELKLNSVIGRAIKANAGSVKVLEKVGMRFESNFSIQTHEALTYRITKAQFANG